jgi:hypothetical protein
LWELHLGDSRDILPGILERENRIALFFHDSLHTYDHMTFEFEEVWPRMDKGAVLLSHDIHWNHAFRDFARRHRQVDHAAYGFGVICKA